MDLLNIMLMRLFFSYFTVVDGKVRKKERRRGVFIGKKSRIKKRRRKEGKIMVEKVVKTLKVRIKNEVLTTRKKERLRRITGRDTRIIEKYVRIIHHNRRKICRRTKKGKGEIRVHKGKLDELTLTTSRLKKVE
ncbi:MAG: hypothetical protein ACTSPJ_09870, partial [Candidatus Heimdallarchaeaceae archaeon]